MSYALLRQFGYGDAGPKDSFGDADNRDSCPFVQFVERRKPLLLAPLTIITIHERPA